MDDILPLFSALADADRIKIAAAIMDRPLSLEEIALAMEQPPKRVMPKVAHLVQVGLVDVSVRDGRKCYRFRTQPLMDAMREVAHKPAEPDLAGDLDAFDRKVLGDFLVDGRLKSIPAQQKKRESVLRFLAERFEMERMYSEGEVNAILAEYHEDTASLRRYLVDGGYLRRQIIREVDAEALIEGNPKIDYRNMYWKEPSVS